MLSKVVFSGTLISLLVGLVACQTVTVSPTTTAVPTNDGIAQTSCGASDILDVSGLAVQPWPPVAGQNLTVFLNGTLSDSISNQSWIAVKVVLAPESSSPQTLINQQYNLCSELGISCPVSAGSFTFNFTEILPSKFPANISIAAYVTAIDPATIPANEIACIQANLTVSSSGKAKINAIADGVDLSKVTTINNSTLSLIVGGDSNTTSTASATASSTGLPICSPNGDESIACQSVPIAAAAAAAAATFTA